MWIKSNESDMPIGEILLLLWSPSSPWTGPLFFYRGEDKSPGKLENELLCPVLCQDDLDMMRVFPF